MVIRSRCCGIHRALSLAGTKRLAREAPPKTDLHERSKDPEFITPGLSVFAIVCGGTPGPREACPPHRSLHDQRGMPGDRLSGHSSYATTYDNIGTNLALNST